NKDRATQPDGGPTTPKREPVAVSPLPPRVTASAGSGVEGTAIALTITDGVQDSDGETVSQLVISGIPTGATLSNSHGDVLAISSANITSTALQPPTGVLSRLKIAPTDDHAFTLTLTA